MGISYLICAAGLGTRTQVINPLIPKPLLKLKGQSLLERSLQSLPLRPEDELVVIHSQNLDKKTIESGLGQYREHPLLKTFAVPLTRGQLETASLAIEEISSANSVCIFNSDTFFKCSTLLGEVCNNSFDGIIPCSEQPGEHWSFCQIGKKSSSGHLVTQVTEKIRISPWCSVGLYWFRSRELFKTYAQIEMNRVPAPQEVYVAPMYNALIEAGFSIGMLECETFKAMGSIEQIQKYWNISLEEMILENKNPITPYI